MDGVHLKYPAVTSSLAPIRERVEAYVAALGFSEEKAHDILVSVEEAATNVVQHSYDRETGMPESQKVVELDLLDTGKGIEVVVSDHGRPFNPTQVPEPDLEKHWAECRTHGLGIYAIRRFMDEIDHRYVDGQGNSFIMRKFL